MMRVERCALKGKTHRWHRRIVRTQRDEERIVMPEPLLRLVVFGALLLHGLGHGGALAALAWIRRFPGRDTGGWRAARSWALPGLAVPSATTVASAFWVLALAGFVTAALAYWGIVPTTLLQPVAGAAAVVSTTGIALFLGTWPAFNTAAALAMNVAVLAALYWPRAA
jgi:hypothetical protein